MALTTRAKVLQTLGLTDDTGSSKGAIAVAMAGVADNVDITRNSSNQLVLGGDVSATYDLTSAAYDTIGEIVTALNGHSGLDADIIDSAYSSYASTLLEQQTLNLTIGNTVGLLTFPTTMTDAKAALIDRLITAVDSQVARYCGFGNSTTGAEEFTSGSRTEYFNGSGQEVLNLSRFPVSSITSVTLLDADGTIVDTLATTDYRLDSVRGELRYVGAGSITDTSEWGWSVPEGPGYARVRVGWPRGWQNIKVIYVGGYSTIPPDLENVATEMVVELYLNRRQNQRAQSEGVNGRNVAYLSPEAALKKYTATLAPFRNEGC